MTLARSALSLLWVAGLGAQGSLDICSASAKVDRKNVELRAVGGLSKEGPYLFDYTCAVASAPNFVLPTVVVLENPTFATDVIAQKFYRLQPNAVYQVRVTGHLQCRSPLKVTRSDDGDVVAANGFGRAGLYACRLSQAHVLALHVLKTD